MTYEKLNALFGMRDRIEDDRERLAEIRANMGAGAAPLTGMPFGTGGNSDKVGDLALKAIEVSDALETEILMYEEALYEAEIFILRIDDPVLQRVIRLRFIEGHTWLEVSNRVKEGYYSEDNCRKMVVNYLARVKMRPVLRSETAWIPTGNRIIKAVQYKDRTCEFIDNGVVVPTSRYVNVRYVKYDEERGMIYKNGRDLPLIKTE